MGVGEPRGSTSGNCMLNVVRAKEELDAEERDRCFTTREVKLLRNVARWMQRVRPDRVRALEVLVSDLLEVAETEEE